MTDRAKQLRDAQKRIRQKRRDQGLVPVEVWVRPEHKPELREIERRMQK